MHWCCAAINFRKKRFEYYDSLYGKNRKCLQLLRSYLESESLDKKKTAYDTQEWIDYIPSVFLVLIQDIPGQENGFDCGVFTIMYMEYTSRQVPFTFAQADMPHLRKRIAYEIITAKLSDS